MRNIFVIGTGTDVGKTFVSALIVKNLLQNGVNVAYYKAAMSGNIRDENNNLIPGDALHVKKISGTNQDLGSMCPYVYERAYSPHLAARIENNQLDMNVIVKKFRNLQENYDCVLVEGSGGILCPLRIDETCEIWLEDVVKALGLSCVLVADAGLGTINAVGLTAEYLREKNIRLDGIIFNRFESGNILHEDNLRMCEKITGVKILACVGNDDSEITWRLQL